MLQAESSCARDWSVYDSPQAVTSERKVRSTKTTYKVNYKRKFYIKSAVMIFGYALILVFLCIKSATLGYQIENLKQDIQNIETANYRMDYEIAEKSSLDRVESVAVAELGMYKPDSKSSIEMEVKAEPVKVASTKASAAENDSISQKLLNKMYNSLSRLAQNTN